ncbi:MAG: hypothetical protein RR879_07465 [Hydrogenoanaerobacterium sp.]
MNWHSGNDYSGKDMARMQNEAAERVREMQERAKRVIGESKNAQQTEAKQQGREKSFTVTTTAKPIIQVPKSYQEAANASDNKTENSGGILSGLFGGDSPLNGAMKALGIDSDKMIIIVLLLILLNNQADKKLILALCYILI